jgi:hypothetical protein
VNPIALTTAACTAALTLGACSSVKPPRFEALSARTAGHTPYGLVLVFELEAINDNPKPMPLRVADYTLWLDGVPVFTGQRSPEATVRRFGSQTFELPAAIPYTTVTPTGPTPYEITGSVSYLEPGRLSELLFDSEVKVPQAGLSVGGTIDFARP